MKQKLLKIIISIIILLGITGCNKTKEEKQLNETNQQEKFVIGHTLDDGRVIHFSFSVPYNNDTLSRAISNKDITLGDFLNQLNYLSMANDGGSKLYKYNKNQKNFGNEDFYVISCNSTYGIKDIYVAKHLESITDKCILKINDLEGVSMTIKEGTLTKTGATVIITDTSDRENIYGNPYRIDKFENSEWNPLDIIYEGNYAWTTIGYYKDENNKLEFTINWKLLYGELKKGKYRIVKDTSTQGEATSHYITAEFIIK